MTLRDALAAVLRDTGPDSPYLDGGEHDRQWADAILSDPAFRDALVESVAEAMEPFDVIDYRVDPHGDIMGITAAAAIVARMLP